MVRPDATIERPEERRFRRIAPIEATSLLALMTASMARELFDGPDLSRPLGSIHGLIFTLYVIAVVQAHAAAGWTAGKALLAVAFAAIPFGGFLVAHRSK
ncbi:MAG: DUF3817 domain-containing protein [Actinomycetota bacterium]